MVFRRLSAFTCTVWEDSAVLLFILFIYIFFIMSNLQLFTSTIRSVDTKNYLDETLGEKAQSFVSNLTALVNNDKNLQNCKPWTIINAALTATTLDLSLNKNMGYAYVIPYADRRTGTSEAQFQMGYKGFIQLAYRTNLFKRINASDVREGELKGFNRLTGDINFEWDDTPKRVNKKIIGYVAYFRLTYGFSKSLYMSVEEVEKHAKRYSQTYASRKDTVKQSSKWSTDFDAMALKTVLKLLLSKYAPLSAEMQKAIESDQSVQRTRDEYIYVDNDTTEVKQRLADVAKAAIAEELPAEDVVPEQPEIDEDNTPPAPTVEDLPEQSEEPQQEFTDKLPF